MAAKRGLQEPQQPRRRRIPGPEAVALTPSPAAHGAGAEAAAAIAAAAAARATAVTAAARPGVRPGSACEVSSGAASRPPALSPAPQLAWEGGRRQGWKELGGRQRRGRGAGACERMACACVCGGFKAAGRAVPARPDRQCHLGQAAALALGGLGARGGGELARARPGRGDSPRAASFRAAARRSRPGGRAPAPHAWARAGKATRRPEPRPGAKRRRPAGHTAPPSTRQRGEPRGGPVPGGSTQPRPAWHPSAQRPGAPSRSRWQGRARSIPPRPPHASARVSHSRRGGEAATRARSRAAKSAKRAAQLAPLC